MIRPATEADLPAVRAVYDHEVAHSVATFDLEPPPLAYWQGRLAGPEPGDHFLVATGDGDEVLGFAYSSSYRPRPAYHRTRETSVYLGSTARGLGLGRRLYDDLLARAAADGVHTVVALVALPNPASEALHRACGFDHVGTMREVGDKLGRWVDTAWYQRMLTGDA